MKDLNSMRNKLQIDDMDLTDRKKLFNEFIKGGGEVIEAKKHVDNKIFQKKSNKTLTQKEDISSDTDNLKTEDTNKTDNEIGPNNISKIEISKSSRVSMNTKFDLWFNALVNDVITLFGSRLSKKFYNYINKNVINIMLESQSMLINALYPPDISSNAAKSKHEIILKSLSGNEDLELLQRYINNYDESSYKIFLHIFETNGRNLKASDYLDILIPIIKPLYITKNYSNRIKIAAEKSFIAYAKLDKINSFIINKKISSFKKSVDVIYDIYYKRLFSIFEYANGRSLKKSTDMANILNIGEEDYVGYYTMKKIKEDELQKKRIDEATKKIGKDSYKKHDKIIEIGLKLVGNLIDYKKIKSKTSNLDDFYFLDKNDKVFRTKVLFDLLDNEYSVVFLTKYVKYNILFDNHQKVDYASEFNNTIISISDLRVRLNEYVYLSQNISKIENDRNIGVEKRLILLKDKNIKRSVASKKLRDSYSLIISSLKISMDRLMLNKEERERVLSNASEILKLDLIITGQNKKLSGYSVIQALTETFYYVSALHYLLTQGELSGSGIFIDDEDTDEDNRNSDEVENRNSDEVKNDINNTVNTEQEDDGEQIMVYDSTKDFHN